MQDLPLTELVPSESKFLSKEDVGETGLNLTIRGFKRDMVGQGDDADERAIVGWKEEDVKPMVINKTNMRRLQAIFPEAKMTSDLIGKQVNVFTDPLIEYGGKIVGGLRIRQAQASDDFDDAIPF